MDLRLEEVADLLRVSPATISKWLQEGRIPSYQIDGVVRFDRMEVEKWMVDPQFLGQGESGSPTLQTGTKQFGLYRALHRGELFHISSVFSKEGLIRAATKLASPSLGLDSEMISDLLIDREQLMPTGIGRGVAVPHPRDLVLAGPSDRIVVVFPENPIEWGSLDEQPVHTIFFLFSGSDKRHLHLLAKLAHLANAPEGLALLRRQPSKEELLQYVGSWEGGLKIPC